MKGFAAELAAAGKPVDDDELKDYILNGLDGNFNSLVAAINAVLTTSLSDMCSQLLSSGDCWWCYGDDDDDDDDDTPKDTKDAYGVDTNWVIDTGATNHTTGQLNKLQIHETYHGRDQVHNASGQGQGHAANHV
uniref:Uncharacterized protein n=1 Tax=Avena sativa TaxID=4498 RepID=A0ACD5WFK3_AVESA